MQKKTLELQMTCQICFAFLFQTTLLQCLTGQLPNWINLLYILQSTMFVQGFYAGSFWISPSSKQYTFTRKSCWKNSRMEDVSKELCQRFVFLAVSQKPSFSNLQDIRIQRNELLRNVTRPFTWKHSQTQAAWVNSWYKEHHLLTGRILTDPDSFARHCMGLPDNPAFSGRCVVLFTFSCSPVLYLVSHLSCSACGSRDSPVTRHVPAVRLPHLPISLPFHFVIEASNVELLPPPVCSCYTTTLQL